MEPAKSKAVQPMCATDPGKVAFNELLSWMGLFDVVSQGHEMGNASADQVRICGDWVVTKFDWTLKSFLPNMHAAFEYISFPKRACNVCNIVQRTHAHTHTHMYVYCIVVGGRATYT